MTFHMSTTVTWENLKNEKEPTGQYHNPNHLMRAVSRKAAINKALRQASALPCYFDRVNAEGMRVTVEAEILGVCNKHNCCVGDSQ